MYHNNEISTCVHHIVHRLLLRFKTSGKKKTEPDRKAVLETEMVLETKPHVMDLRDWCQDILQSCCT